MAASTIPVTGDRLRVETDDNTEVLGNAPQEETCHPKLIAHFNPFTWSNLELPLSRHDFGVRARYFNTFIWLLNKNPVKEDFSVVNIPA